MKFVRKAQSAATGLSEILLNDKLVKFILTSQNSYEILQITPDIWSVCTTHTQGNRVRDKSPLCTKLKNVNIHNFMEIMNFI
jgi:hypothetical protein